MLRFLTPAAALAILLLADPAAAEAVDPTVNAAHGTVVQPVGDALLTAFIEQALNQSPSVQEALAAVEAEAALERAAGRPLYNPLLELDAENADTETRSVGISQTLDWADKRGARSRVAAAEVSIALAELAQVRQEIGTQILSALARYQVASRLRELAAQRLKLMQQFAGLADRRQRAGDLAPVELNLANLARTEAQIRLASATSALASAERELQTLVAAPLRGQAPALPAELQPVTIDLTESERLIAELPQIRIERERVRAAASTVDLRRRQRRADPTIVVRGGEEDSEALIGINFSIPLHVRNRFTDEVTAARAERRRTERSLAAIELRAEAALSAATSRYLTTRDAWLSWLKTGAPNLAQQSALLQHMWEAGELSTTDFLVQFNQTLETRQSALELQQELWLAWFDWLAASGQIEPWLGLVRETKR